MAKVLVIEDDERTRNLYKAAITFQGIDVILAHNSEIGFSKVKKESPDLIILDIMLPDSEGINLIKKLKQHAETHSLPVIILSDLKNESIKKEASILGACDYLVKSESSVGEIIKKVREALHVGKRAVKK